MESIKKKYRSLLVVLSTILFLTTISYSCKDDFTTDSQYRLTLSVDTLKLDTILTQTISSTNIVKVYNQTEEDIKVASILFESEKGYFQINVNGKAGRSFSDVKIASGDSLYIFVQIMASELGQNAPLLIEDKIKFIYNGNTQQVVLSAYGQDAYHIRNTLHIDQNTVWNNDKPYLVYDSIIVDSVATWTIQHGARIFMHKKATILVNGTMKVEGVLGDEVLFRTHRTDRYSSKIAYDQMANQWKGIHIGSSSQKNEIHFANIMGGAFGIEIDSSEINDDYRLILANSTIMNMESSCLKAHHAKILAYNTIFANGENGSVVLSCGDYQFDHCTIATYKRGMGFYSKALTLSNKGLAEFKEELNLPMKAHFNNCIIYGNSGTQSEILFMQPKEKEVSQMDYMFDHCLLLDKLTEEELNDSTHYNMTIINEKPNFVSTDYENLQYDFHLAEDSPCKEKGDIGQVLKKSYLQTDREGVVRNVEAAPDLGALQIVITEEGENEEESK